MRVPHGIRQLPFLCGGPNASMDPKPIEQWSTWVNIRWLMFFVLILSSKCKVAIGKRCSSSTFEMFMLCYEMGVIVKAISCIGQNLRNQKTKKSSLQRTPCPAWGISYTEKLEILKQSHIFQLRNDHVWPELWTWRQSWLLSCIFWIIYTTSPF